MSQYLAFHLEVCGTLDQMEPLLRARGFTHARVLSGPISLANLDPYGMRRIGSPNIQSERWAHHIYRGILAQSGDVFYLADATADGHAKTPEAPFVGGLFELLQGEA